MSQLCYFDYAATTPVRGEVIAAMTAALIKRLLKRG